MVVTLDTSHSETFELNAEARENTAESTTTTKEHKRGKNKVRVCETKVIVKFEGRNEKRKTKKEDELKYVL